MRVDGSLKSKQQREELHKYKYGARGRVNCLVELVYTFL